MRILLIEDDKEAARLLARGLREEGWIVDIAFSGESGDEMASVNTYDAIVLDWMLPDRDGIAVCQSLRGSGLHVPILILTARDAIEDRVLGLNSGADDYLTKPFAFAELLARIRALVRRGRTDQALRLKLADLEMDLVSRHVQRGDHAIGLTAREFE